MKDAYIVKKSVKRNPIKPTESISYEEFQLLVDRSPKLTWLEETKHGKRWVERYPNKPKRLVSYLNIDELEEKSFVQVQYSKFGYLKVQFDFKSTKDNLNDLIAIADSINCNLWQYKPIRQVLTHEMVNNRYKQPKPRRKPQTNILVPKLWIHIRGDFKTFLKVFRPEIEKQNATITRINNNTKSNNRFLIIQIDNDKFYIVGEGIKCLYEKEFHSGNTDKFKSKFIYQLNSIFNEITVNDNENELVDILNEIVGAKSEIIIAKVQKRLF